MRELRQHRGKGMTDHINITAQVQVEERQASDAQREARHLRLDIHRVRTCVLPAFEHCQRRIGHDRSEVRQALVVEERLHEPPLMQPGLAIAGEESVAEEGKDRAKHRGRLVVVTMMIVEDLLLKVNYHSTVVRIKSADQTPSVIAESFGREKASWLACHPPFKRASSDNEAGDACQLCASVVGVC